MTPRAFDAIACRAAHALNRRELLGVVFGATLTVAQCPLPTRGKKDDHHGSGGDHHGSGGHDGGGGGGGHKNTHKNDKKCKKQATACVAAVGAYCNEKYYFDEVSRNLCKFEYHRCCGYYRDCKPANANICIQEGVF